MTVQLPRIRINKTAFFTIALSVVYGHGALGANVAKRDASLAYIFTSTPRYEPKAWLAGRARFPQGAHLVAVEAGTLRQLAQGICPCSVTVAVL